MISEVASVIKKSCPIDNKCLTAPKHVHICFETYQRHKKDWETVGLEQERYRLHCATARLVWRPLRLTAKLFPLGIGFSCVTVKWLPSIFLNWYNQTHVSALLTENTVTLRHLKEKRFNYSVHSQTHASLSGVSGHLGEGKAFPQGNLFLMDFQIFAFLNSTWPCRGLYF